MATMTFIDEKSKEGADTLKYKDMIKDGLAGLRKQEGTRAHSAATTVGPMKVIFGISNSELTEQNTNLNAGAEAFRDRLNAINGGNLTGLQEFCDVTLADPTKV
jgi:hypothetical protein